MEILFTLKIKRTIFYLKEMHSFVFIFLVQIRNDKFNRFISKTHLKRNLDLTTSQISRKFKSDFRN